MSARSAVLVETTISRDVLLMRRVDKPALLRRLFELGCRYSGRILSYNKMLGQLQELVPGIKELVPGITISRCRASCRDEKRGTS